MEKQHCPKYKWPNRLSFEDRKEIVDYYLQGYAVYTITKAFNSTQTTIEYHLKNAGVFMIRRKATKQGPIQRQTFIQMRSLVYPIQRRLITKLDNEQYYYDEYGYRYSNHTKTYKDYLREERLRKPIFRDNDRAQNRGAGDTFKPWIKVYLTDVPSFEPMYSNSILSW